MSQASFSNPKFASFKNLKIGVLAGGDSSERKISLRSGRAVTKALKRLGFETVSIDPIHRESFYNALQNIDLAFIALHGHGGEDGEIQKILERKGLPYIGSDAVSSKRAFDKAVAKKIFSKHRISTPSYRIANRKNWRQVIKGFGVPCFVKPLKEGSSIGAFAVEDLEKTAVKIKQTLNTFGDLLVEQRIEGRELTVGVLGSRALPVVEMKPKREFYDYRAKYTKGMTKYTVPAKISPFLARKLQSIALRVHKSLGLRDFSRVDIMLDRNDHPYVLEANSIPGFTELSLLPKAAQAAGITFENLCLQLVVLAYKRSTEHEE